MFIANKYQMGDDGDNNDNDHRNVITIISRLRIVMYILSVSISVLLFIAYIDDMTTFFLLLIILSVKYKSPNTPRNKSLCSYV